MREAAIRASEHLDVSDAEINRMLREMADRVNAGLDATTTATIALMAAEESVLGVSLKLIGERVLRFRHYNLYVGDEKLAHWVRKMDGLRD